MKYSIDKYGNPILTGNRVYKCGNPELVFTVNRAGSLVRYGQIAFKQGEWFPSDYVVEGKEPLETSDTTVVTAVEPEEPAEPKVPFLNEEEAADLYEEQPVKAKSTHERKAEFLKAMKELGSAHKALKATGISVSLIYKWRENDKEFFARYNELQEKIGNRKFVSNQKAVNAGSLESISDQTLVDALRKRGWTVKCEKMVSL